MKTKKEKPGLDTILTIIVVAVVFYPIGLGLIWLAIKLHFLFLIFFGVIYLLSPLIAYFCRNDTSAPPEGPGFHATVLAGILSAFTDKRRR